MYFPKIRKTQAQLELMIDVLTMEYKAKNDDQLAILMAKYFDVSEDDARSSLLAYREHKSEDYEQISRRVEYA